MRGPLITILMTLLLVLIVLFAAAVTAVGIAAIGLLLHRWFALTQWEGSLIAIVASVGFGFLLYRLLSSPLSSLASSDWEEEEEEEEAPPEPPVVPWRRNRPTPGTLPQQQSQSRGATPPAKTRK
ncbi:MAG: hypothetical protein WHX53_08700 [Anaerolineae bacterium]